MSRLDDGVGKWLCSERFKLNEQLLKNCRSELEAENIRFVFRIPYRLYINDVWVRRIPTAKVGIKFVGGFFRFFGARCAHQLLVCCDPVFDNRPMVDTAFPRYDPRRPHLSKSLHLIS